MKKTACVLGSLIISTAFLASPAFAISYYQNKDGAIAKIDQAAFDKCTTIIYRQVAKDELSADHKRSLVSAMLKGESVNELSAASAALKRTAGACTYGADSEKFE